VADEQYPDYRIAALKCLSDNFPDIPWSDIQNGYIDAIPPSGCWCVTATNGHRFLVYVGNHPAAPSAEIVAEAESSVEFSEDELEQRRNKIKAIQTDIQAITAYTRAIGRELYLKSIKDRAQKEPWRGEPAWLRDVFRDSDERRTYWNKQLKDAGVISTDQVPHQRTAECNETTNIRTQLETGTDDATATISDSNSAKQIGLIPEEGPRYFLKDNIGWVIAGIVFIMLMFRNTQMQDDYDSPERQAKRAEKIRDAATLSRALDKVDGRYAPEPRRGFSWLFGELSTNKNSAIA